MTATWNSRADGTGRGRSDWVTVLSFDLADTRYCVRAESVASVLDVTGDENLATSRDPWDAGRVTVEGERIRVIDLPRAFTPSIRTTARIDESKLLVFTETDDDGAYFGWIVDDINVTKMVRASTLEPARTAATTTYVKGRIEVGDDDAIWLDERAIHG